jgi:hypothetical protein
MKKLAVILALILAAPCFSQEAPKQALPIIAMSRADAESCQTGDCKIITAQVFQALSARLQLAEQLEEVVKQQAAEIKRVKDNRCM